jgi:hypothetical protein
MKTLAIVSLLSLLPLAAQPGPDRKARRQFMEKMGHGEGRLKVGDMAADFNLKKMKSEERVRLSSFKGERPVALVFGSYT